MATVKCKNCAHTFHGNFCPHCGQSAKEHRINVSYFLHDIPHSVLHIDKGFLYTLKELFRRPGKTLKEYLGGKRVMHFKPFAFVLILSTICTLLSKGIEFLIAQNIKGATFSHAFFSKYPSILIFLMIPILSLVTWLFFKKYPFNYWEHFLVNTYLGACLNIFFLLIKFALLIKSYNADSNIEIKYTWFMFLFMTLYGFAFSQLMGTGKDSFKMVLRILLMNFVLATVYMSALSVTGLMDPWWNF